MIHLHNHSVFSFLDSIVKIDDYIEKTKELGVKYLSLTDHGNLCGIFELYKKCKKNNITPIIGCEFYYSEGEKVRAKDHLVVIAKNNEGLRNLFELSSKSYLTGFYYRPTIHFKDLLTYRKGLIISTACIGGTIPKFLLNNQFDDAYNHAKKFMENFEDFYLEMQLHNVQKQVIVNNGIARISHKLGIPLVMTNDVHYIDKRDNAIQDFVSMIRMNRTIKNHVYNDFRDLYFKTDDDLYNNFKNMKKAMNGVGKIDFSQSMENTYKIAEMIKKGNIKIDQSLKLPKIDIKNSKKELKSIVETNFKNKIDNNIIGKDQIIQYRERIETEYDVIFSKSFQDYFLVIEDIIKYCNNNDIYVGIGRGSAGGSLVAYLLGITQLDPIKYGLKFERFITKKRSKLQMILDME